MQISAQDFEKARVFASQNLLSYAIGSWPGYRPAAHHELIAKKLEAVERGEIKRLMLFLPPRHGKSQLTSQFFASWYLGRNPEKYIISATYSQELAEDFGRSVRNQLKDNWFHAVFPKCRIADDSQSAKRFGTTEKGSYFAVGAGASITGRGAHVLLIDDPIKNREDADSEAIRRKVKEWYTSTAYTRLMPDGAVILIQTRWHEDDLAGWLLREHGHEHWDVVDLPALDDEGNALWPEQYSADALRHIKNTIGSRDWEALYQQRPTQEGGNILRSSYFRVWPDDMKYPPPCDHIFYSFDTAYSTEAHKNSSYSCYSKYGIFHHEQQQRYCIMLLGCWAGRVDYPDLRRKALELWKNRDADAFLIEKKASGQSLIQDLRRAGIPVRTYQPDRDKIARAYAVQAMLESGQVYIPNKQWAWNFVDLVGKFPSGPPLSFDYTDTLTQALLYLRNGLWVEHPDDIDDTPPEKPLYDIDEDDKAALSISNIQYYA